MFLITFVFIKLLLLIAITINVASLRHYIGRDVHKPAFAVKLKVY